LGLTTEKREKPSKPKEPVGEPVGGIEKDESCVGTFNSPNSKMFVVKTEFVLLTKLN
jgi:hypothetical protein